MKLHIIASGSSGNCACIDSGEHNIFIDVGVSVSKVRAQLGIEAYKKPTRLFITHEHTDHILGIKPFINQFNPIVYASEKTADVLVQKGVNPDTLYVLDADCCYDFDDFSVTPFNLMHDAVEPFGYKFNFSDTSISFATDFGVVSDYLRRSVEGSETLLLESNYEDDILKKSKYPAALKSRISGCRGHLSNREALNFVADMSDSGLKQCFLAHVSENSNSYDLLDKYAKTCEECYGVETIALRQQKSLNVMF